MKKLITAIAIIFISIAQAQVNIGLVAKYSFNNGNANDEIGSNHGMVNGAVLTTNRFGEANKAYKFTNGEYIALPDASALKSTMMTVSLWTKVDSFLPSNVGTNYIYSVINSTTNAYFAAFSMSIYSSTSTYLLVSQNGPSESVLGFSSNTYDSTWQHLVMSMDNDSLKMWVDGVLQWTIHKGFTTTFTKDSIYIGASGNSTYNGNLNGSVDDIRVYNRVLTNTEVDSLYYEPQSTNLAINYDIQILPNHLFYPNPTTGIINISEKKIITLKDLSGKTVIPEQLTKSLDISHFANGIYIMQIEDNTGIFNYKIVKE